MQGLTIHQCMKKSTIENYNDKLILCRSTRDKVVSKLIIIK
jgi:hypothetical protein